MRHITEYVPAKTGWPSDILQFWRFPRVVKKIYLKDNKHNSHIWLKKYVQIVSQDIIISSRLKVIQERGYNGAV